MPKLDFRVYGLDETSFAGDVAADALANTSINAEGGDIDQSAQSRSAKDTLRLAETATVKSKTVGGGSDSRATSQGNAEELG